MSGSAPVPAAVVMAVEDYVSSELDQAAKYGNRTPLDESGIWSLHRLAGDLYAMGFADGVAIEGDRRRHEVRRQRSQ